MKLKTDADIERIAKAIEMDAGQSISTIRDALSEVRDGNVGATYTKEQLIVRATRAKTELSQAEFAEAINTPARTLQEWEQGRATPQGWR